MADLNLSSGWTDISNPGSGYTWASGYMQNVNDSATPTTAESVDTFTTDGFDIKVRLKNSSSASSKADVHFQPFFDYTESPTRSGPWVDIFLLTWTTTNYFQFRIFDADDVVQKTVQLSKYDYDGADLDTWMWGRIKKTGNDYKFKHWREGDGEPGAWDSEDTLSDLGTFTGPLYASSRGSGDCGYDDIEFLIDISENVAVTENISVILDFSGSLPEISETVAVTENISVQIFEAWLESSATDQIALSENITAELEIPVLPNVSETIAVTESITAELEIPVETSIDQDIAVTENFDVALHHYLSGTETIGIEEFIDAALDIPTNWVALADANLTKEKYYFTLTGANDGTTDIEIPISSFQARKRTAEATYLSVVVRDYETNATAIADRPNGEMIIEMNYEYNNESSIRQEIVRADLEDIKLYQGPRNRSIGLTGHKTITFANRSVTLENATYKATVEGRRTFRFAKAHPYLNPGDTLVVGSDSMTVDYIVYMVSPQYKTMEVREIG